MDSDRKDAALLLDLIYALPSHLATSECCDALRAGAAALRREHYGEVKSVAHEIDQVLTVYARRKVVPLTAEERQIVARLEMWRKRLTEVTP